MKALQVVKPHEMRLIEKDAPSIERDDDVLVKVRATGICGSDVHILHGTSPVATYPRVIGHEVVGEVVETGRAATALRRGDRVILEPIEYCGKCYACRQGRGNVCRELKVKGVHADGGFQEFIVARESFLHLLPQGATFVQSVMIEPYTIGYQSNWRADVRAGDVVLIYGAGPVGLIALDRAKELGAVCYVSDVQESRLALAADFGADGTFNPAKENVEARIVEITGGMGPNVVFDAVGIPSILAGAVRIASVAGRVVSMGFTDEPAPISMLEITKKELTVVGTRLQTKKFQEVIRDFPNRLAKVDKLITHVFPFADYEKAFGLIEAKAPNLGKIVLTYGD